MSVGRVLACLAALLTLGMLLVGCTSASGQGGSVSGQGESGTGFVAGDGSIVVLDQAQRVAAPAITGQTLDGGSFDLADYRGQVVVLNVWASWCAPCRAEAPILEQVATDLAAEPVAFIGLDTRDSPASAQAFVTRFGVTYPQVIDEDGQLQLQFRDTLPPQAIPSTIIIDADGQVAARILGQVSEASLRGVIDEVIGEVQ